MDGWKKWEGRKVFLRLKNTRVYSGIVIEVEESSIGFFISIKDKYNNSVMIADSEIAEIKEEQ